jgi:elongator complex protein 3
MSIEEEIVNKLIDESAKTRSDFVRIVGEVYSAHQVQGYHRNIDLRDTYDQMLEAGIITQNQALEKLLVTKKMRSLSGVSIITVLTKPYDCPGKCIYCPTEQDVPKSYLSNEPAVMRAILNQYDPANQVKTRMDSLSKQGHPIDKIELIVIGGTFNYLPKKYQEEFIKGCFDALNGVESNDLADAKKINETAKSRCVGLTLETRPDFITEDEAVWFRYLGATRVEMGVQSVYDEVLSKNARGHDVAASVKATKLLKDAGFKITYHLMPNLYGSNPQMDKEMFGEVFENPDFRPDYIKIYPCMVMANTALFDLYKKGEFKPYTDKELIDLISEVKKHVPYWIRIMRTIRDIPASSIVAGSKMSNLRQVVLANTKEEGWICHCIRCREAKEICAKEEELFVEEYDASGGQEYFLSFEDKKREILFSLLRLRLTENQFIEEIKDCALIREVHTYGQQVEIGEKGVTQHKGFGKRLLAEAENIAREKGFKKIAVISGVGVRDYYKKFGYQLAGEYMIKSLV